MDSELRRAIAFEEGLRERCAERIVPFRFGRAVFNDTFRSVYDLNVLRVDQPEGATTETLAAEAERLHGEAGQPHRRIVVPDEKAGERLASGFRELGWKSGRFLVMAWRGRGERTGDAGIVEEVAAEDQRSLRERIVAAEPWAESPEVVQAVVDSALVIAEAGRARHFGLRVDGEVVSATDLYSDGRTAQVEDVATSPEHRGKGYASALVVRAVMEAERAGARLRFPRRRRRGLAEGALRPPGVRAPRKEVGVPQAARSGRPGLNSAGRPSRSNQPTMAS